MKIVIVISVKKEEKKLVIEKWCLSPNIRHRPPTHPNPNPPAPTMMHELTVVQNPSIPQPDDRPPQIVNVQIGGTSYNVTGAPLTIEFDKIFLRPPVPPNEHDLVFDTAALADIVDDFRGGGPAADREAVGD